MDALDFLMGLVKRDPNTLQTAGADPQAAGQALDLVGQGLGAAFAPQRLGLQIGQHAMEGAAALGETAMGTAFPRGFAQQAPLARDAGDYGLPPSVSQQVAAEGAFDPLGGIGRALGWASGPIPTLGPPLPDSPEGTTGAWTLNPDANPLDRLGYAIERTRGAEHFNPQAFPGQKGLGELAANPLSYVGFGIPGRLASQATNPLLRQILGGAAEAEGLWNQVPGEVMRTAWQGAQGLPGIGQALQTSKRAAAGMGEDAMRGIISGLDAAAGQFPELQGANPWRVLSGLQGVTKEGQVAAEAATAGLAASGLDRATLRHWGDQATQDKELGRKLVSLTQRLTPSVTEPIDLGATRTALEQRAGITAADTDALLQEALPRLSTLARKQPGWETSADVGKMIQEVQIGRLAEAGTPVEAGVLRSPEYDLPLKAAQAAWLAERYGNIIPATVGRGATANEAAVLARANRAGGTAAGAGERTAPGAAAPSAPPTGSGVPFSPETAPPFTPTGPAPEAPPTSGAGAPSVAPGEALAGAETVAPPGAPAGPAPVASSGVPAAVPTYARGEAGPVVDALGATPGMYSRAPEPAVTSAEGLPQNVAYHVTQAYDGGALRAQPFPNSGDPTPLVWLRSEGPIGRPGQVLEVDLGKLDPTKMTTAGSGFPAYAGDIPPEAIRQIGEVRPGAAGRMEFVRSAETPIDPAAYQAGLNAGLDSKAAMEQARRYAPRPEPPLTGTPGGEVPPSSPPGGNLAPDTTAISQSVLRMTPGDPAFQAKLVQDAPDLVARYDTAKTATEDLLAQTGAKDLRALTTHEDPAVVAQAKKILNDMGGADPSVLPETEVLNNAWTRDYMRSKGVTFNDPNFLQQAATEVMQIWRQQALFAPAFFVRNQIDGMTRMLLYAGKLGVEHPINPFGAGGRVGSLGGAADPDSFWQIWSRAFTRAGQEAPEAGAWTSAADQFRAGIHGAPAPPGVLGSMQGTELLARRGLERVPDIPLPFGRQVPLGRTMRTFRELYTAQEQAMRGAGYWHAYEDAIPQALPALTTQLTDALGDNGAPVLQVVQDAKGYLSPKVFSDALSGVNVSPEAKIAAETAFGAYKSALQDAGTSFANKLFINYKDTTNADEFLRNFLGFHVFATRSIPFYLETLATHPGLLRGVQMFQAEKKAQNQREGTTKNRRLQYAVDLPSQEDFITALFGQAGQAMVDPTGYVSMVQAPLQAMDENPQEARGTNLIGSVLNQLQRVGISVAPWYQVPLQIAGAYGGQQPANLLRLEPLAESGAQWATGQPIEAPWNAIQRMRVGPMADRMPNDPAMTVRLKLREMALEQDRDYADAHPMDPISPRFRQAMLAGGKDPLWQQAASLVGRQQFLQGASSFVTGAPLTFRSGTAAATDAIQAGLPEVNAQGGSKPFEPAIPNPGVAPGTPLETYTMRDRRLQGLAAAGHPEASGLSQAFQRNLGEPGGSLRPSVSSAARNAVQTAYQQADPVRQAAMLADPALRPYILDLQSQRWRQQMHGLAPIDRYGR